MAIGLIGGLVVFTVGLAATFARPGLRGRLAGLAGMALGALLALAAAPPEPSWAAAVTVALTLAPVLVVAYALRRRIEQAFERDDVTLDDDPR